MKLNIGSLHVPEKRGITLFHFRRCKPCSIRWRLNISQARGSFFRKVTSCEEVQLRCSAADFKSSSQLKTASKHSASSAGKSACLGLTEIRLLRHRVCHSELGLAFSVRRLLAFNARLTRKRNNAIFRFSGWLLLSDASAEIPVGRCVMITAVSTLSLC